MSEIIITMQIQDHQCTISMPSDAWFKVKVYAIRHQCPVLTAKSNVCTIHLKPGETVRLDVYGADGEAQLLSAPYLLDESGNLVPQKAFGSTDEGILIKQVSPPQ